LYELTKKKKKISSSISIFIQDSFCNCKSSYRKES